MQIFHNHYELTLCVGAIKPVCRGRTGSRDSHASWYSPYCFGQKRHQDTSTQPSNIFMLVTLWTSYDEFFFVDKTWIVAKLLDASESYPHYPQMNAIDPSKHSSL